MPGDRNIKLIVFFDCLYRWDETSEEESESMDQSNSDEEQVSDYGRRPKRQAAVATKKRVANRKGGNRKKNYSSGDSDSDDDNKRCVCSNIDIMDNFYKSAIFPINIGQQHVVQPHRLVTKRLVRMKKLIRKI